MNDNKSNTNFESGYVRVPWITKTKATKINNTTVWHSNPFLNLLIKIRNFFYTPKDLKKFNNYYSNKKINFSKFKTININKDEK